MPLVHIKSRQLSSGQKKAIGQKIISIFREEGFLLGSVVVLFGREDADILSEDGLLFEMEADPRPAEAPRAAPAPMAVAAVAEDPDGDFKNKVRRSKGELSELKNQLTVILQAKGALSSFQAQEDLGLKTCDWAPATLRRFFSELEEEGLIVKQGQKRGTRYVWKGISTQPSAAAPQAKLVKRAEDESPAEE